MPMLDTVKNAVVGQAMRWISDPRLTRVVSDPRVMNAAMKAMAVGGTVKSELDKATRFAAGIFGFATQEEVVALRSTIQTLEETIATLEHQAAASSAASSSPR